MSVSTSISNTNQLYPNSSSDGQWNQETSNVNQPKETPFLVVDPQFRNNSVNCNGSSAIYNAPKITSVSNFNCINGQLFNSPNYVGPCFSSVQNGQDIRLQTQYNGLNNPGMMIHSARDGHIALRNNTWSSPVLNRDRLISRPTWNSAKPSGGVKKPKRIRTAFTSQQMMELENEYVRTRYLDRSRRIELSEILKLNERTIKIWFQNRRMKEKKVKTENIDDTEATSTTESTLEMDNRQMIMYDPYPHNGVYNRNIYVEQYPVVSPGMSLQETGPTSLVGSVETLPMNSYSTFVVDNNLQIPEFDMQYRQMNMQMQEYSINDKNEGIESNQVTLEDSSHQSENSTNDASKNGGDDESWDLSWIRSIHIDEEI